LAADGPPGTPRPPMGIDGRSEGVRARVLVAASANLWAFRQAPNSPLWPNGPMNHMWSTWP
jgi:hypothetical protein